MTALPARPRRIGYLVSQYPASSHTFIRREIASLRRHGVTIAAFSVRRPGEAELVAEADRAACAETAYVLPLSVPALIGAHVAALFTSPVRYLRTFALALGHRAPGAKALVWSLFHFAEAVLLARMLRRAEIAHLHNHFANSGATVGLLATRFLGLPWSLTLHGISETDYPAGLLLGDKLRAAEFVACVSWFGRAQAMRVTAPADWHKFMIVRCGLDLATLGTPEPRPPSTAFRIVCVGRLSAEKGHLGLVEAVAGLRAEGRAVHLTLIGDGPERAAIERSVSAAGLADVVTFAGRLDEQAVLAEVPRHDCLVLPSFMEGLPIVLMEAMALGVPVVASRVAGVPELIADGTEGLLFRPSDWDDLRAAIGRLIDGPKLAATLAEAARGKVAREFDVATSVLPLVTRFDADSSHVIGDMR